MKRSKLSNTLIATNIEVSSAQSVMTSRVHIALFLLAATACGFPRPPDVSGDAPEDSGSGTTGPGIAIHVSPFGDDLNDGLTSPVKTLKHAIGLAAANTQITQIILVIGNYAMSSGETFPYTVPSNVTIIGPAGGGAVLVGDKSVPGMTVDAGGLQDLDLQGFTTAITVTGTASLKNIRVLTSMIALQAETAASLTINNLDISGTTATCAAGVVLNGNAVLTGSTFATRALGTSLFAKDHSTVMISKVTVTGDPSCANSPRMVDISSAEKFTLRDGLIDGGSSGINISSSSGSAPTQAILEDVIVRNVDMDALVVGNATVQMAGGELSHTRQTSLEVVGGNCSLTNVSILSSGTAFYSQDAILTMRGCTISNNTTGGDLGIRAVGDFGTVSNPGNNVFNNEGVGLLVEGGNGVQVIHAVGNTWKPVQGAGLNGKYPMGTVVPGPISCTSNNDNFCIQASDEGLEL